MDDGANGQSFKSSSVMWGEDDDPRTYTYRVKVTTDGFLACCKATKISREGKTLALAVESLRAAIAVERGKHQSSS
jgi:hypothetical protein